MYENKIKKLKHKYITQSKLVKKQGPKNSGANSKYTEQEQEMMLDDYEGLLCALEEAHQKLQNSSANYRSVANEKDHSSATILKLMLNHLNDKIKAQDEIQSQKRKRCASACVDLGEGKVMFKPKQFLSIDQDSPEKEYYEYPSGFNSAKEITLNPTPNQLHGFKAINGTE